MCLLHSQSQEPHVYSRTFQEGVHSTGQPWEVGASLQVCRERSLRWKRRDVQATWWLWATSQAQMQSEPPGHSRQF